MKTRIINNWKSTLIGLFLFALAIYLIVNKLATPTEAIGILISAGVFTWMRDTFFTVNPKKE